MNKVYIIFIALSFISCGDQFEKDRPEKTVVVVKDTPTNDHTHQKERHKRRDNYLDWYKEPESWKQCHEGQFRELANDCVVSTCREMFEHGQYCEHDLSPLVRRLSTREFYERVCGHGN